MKKENKPEQNTTRTKIYAFVILVSIFILLFGTIVYMKTTQTNNIQSILKHQTETAGAQPQGQATSTLSIEILPANSLGGGNK